MDINKKDLARMARIMYDLQERCTHSYYCTGCPAYTGEICKIKTSKTGVPANWMIKKVTVDILEKEAHE